MGIRDSLTPLLQRIIHKQFVDLFPNPRLWKRAVNPVTNTFLTQLSKGSEFQARFGISTVKLILQCPWNSSYNPASLPLKNFLCYFSPFSAVILNAKSMLNPLRNKLLLPPELLSPAAKLSFALTVSVPKVLGVPEQEVPPGAAAKQSPAPHSQCLCITLFLLAAASASWAPLPLYRKLGPQT